MDEVGSNRNAVVVGRGETDNEYPSRYRSIESKLVFEERFAEEHRESSWTQSTRYC